MAAAVGVVRSMAGAGAVAGVEAVGVAADMAGLGDAAGLEADMAGDGRCRDAAAQRSVNHLRSA